MGFFSDSQIEAMNNYYLQMSYAGSILENEHFTSNLCKLAFNKAKTYAKGIRSGCDLLQFNNYNEEDLNKKVYDALKNTLDNISQGQNLSCYEIFSRLAENNHIWTSVYEELDRNSSQKGHSFGEEFIYQLIYSIRYRNNQGAIDFSEKTVILENAPEIFNQVLKGLIKENEKQNNNYLFWLADLSTKEDFSSMPCNVL